MPEDSVVKNGREALSLCNLPKVPPRTFEPGFDPNRARAILQSDRKWVNGTHLHYYFLDDKTPFFANDVEVVRNAFRDWRNLPIGLKFSEVSDPQKAELRIGFDFSGDSWSMVGRDALQVPVDLATMNFGWPLSFLDPVFGRDTALHEIGHALGLQHEHQNPTAGIEWNEPEVYEFFSGPPNYWDLPSIEWNILRKISPDEVQGSSWDPDSIMHYGFEAGLILVPQQYQTEPLTPTPGLSERDTRWVKTFYPQDPDENLSRLESFESQWFDLGPGEQVNLLIEPSETRQYQFAAFGTADTVLVLFEETPTGSEELQELTFCAGDDDSGCDRNAHLNKELIQGRRYVLRLRLYWPSTTGRTAVMMW